ncbi:TatD family hydrolase [Paraferrimonas haliotis]|uniref:Hydrolase TatD family protein n=1 Tax=Paraferrimonas haliotis TaxID=2013866 RepID=A0AA37TT32_9GAMM|nr:TatD family hydrolase [Paraferrimonas haliotis]GLS83832.1 hydrolase TatD family protein [Paraferrimonas haliotis]GLS83959.1 hydrolase TatD family protein [Paraferrimonas haliotis]
MFDSHCHLDFLANSPVNLDAAVAAYRERCDYHSAQHDHSSSMLLIPGVAPEQWPIAAALAARLNCCYSVGLHPWWLDVAPKKRQSQMLAFRHWLDEHSQDKLCRAVGECGLDGTRKIALSEQLPVLEQQLLAAQESRLAVVLHCVKAHAQLQSQLKSLSVPWVIHGFYGSLQLAEQYLSLSTQSYLGIGTMLLRSGNNKLERVVQDIPLSRLVLETDEPRAVKGELNIPWYKAQWAVAQRVADLKQCPITDVIKQSNCNAELLFARLI